MAGTKSLIRNTLEGNDAFIITLQIPEIVQILPLIDVARHAALWIKLPPCHHIMYIPVGEERLEDTVSLRWICVDSREELAHLFSATTHQTSRIGLFPRERLKRLLLQCGKRHFSR